MAFPFHQRVKGGYESFFIKTLGDGIRGEATLQFPALGSRKMAARHPPPDWEGGLVAYF